MISLKKYLDLDPEELRKFRQPEPEEQRAIALLEAYRAAITAMGNCGSTAGPVLDFGLKESLGHVREQLKPSSSPDEVREVEKRLEERLHRWSEQAGNYLKQKADEVKQILIVLAGTAESATTRDDRYVAQFTDLSKRFQAIGDLEDLSRIRSLLAKNAQELQSAASQMAEDGRQSVDELKAQVTAYQSRLEQAELLATRDTLTGLHNRRSIESHLRRLTDAKKDFSVLIIDLDRFKALNDHYGHKAGDELLKHFSGELRSQARPGEMAGRWGGDEFIVLVEGNMRKAEDFAERIEKWVCGSYTVQTGVQAIKVQIGASVGWAQWMPPEPVEDVVARADHAMYKQKRSHKGLLM